MLIASFCKLCTPQTFEQNINMQDEMSIIEPVSHHTAWGVQSWT